MAFGVASLSLSTSSVSAVQRVFITGWEIDACGCIICQESIAECVKYFVPRCFTAAVDCRKSKGPAEREEISVPTLFLIVFPCLTACWVSEAK